MHYLNFDSTVIRFDLEQSKVCTEEKKTLTQYGLSQHNKILQDAKV